MSCSGAVLKFDAVGGLELVQLDQGDLKDNVDFRGVYASVLEGWLKTPSKPVQRGDFSKLGVIG